MAVTTVQAKAAATASASSLAAAFDSNVTAGSCLVVIGFLEDTVKTLSVADTQTNSYTVGMGPIDEGTGQNIRTYVWYCASAAAGATTVTITPTSSDPLRLCILELSGHHTAPWHTSNQLVTFTSATPSGAAITPTVAGRMYASFNMAGNHTVSSWGGGFAAVTNGASARQAVGEQAVVASTTYTPSITFDATEEGQLVSFVIAEASAGGHPLPQRVFTGPRVGPFRGPF